MYDRGYWFSRYDLVVTAVHDKKAAVAALRKIDVPTVDVSYEQGQVWRIQRGLTEPELRTALARLPCVFGPISLYFKYEHLEEVRVSKAFSFEALEYRGPS
jgi:hypothetical protein